MTDPASSFVYREAPDHPGWMCWEPDGDGRFNALFGTVLVRVEQGVARVRMTPAIHHANPRHHVHGGALLGFIDIALFAGARGLGVVRAAAGVTLDLSTQFIESGRLDQPLEARIELLRETGRLLFLRGLIVQDDVPAVASFTATLRKGSAPAPDAG